MKNIELNDQQIDWLKDNLNFMFDESKNGVFYSKPSKMIIADLVTKLEKAIKE
jgi:hypothetical protein